MGINLPFGKFIVVIKALKTYTKQILPEYHIPTNALTI
jgi:hypothetical protein